MHGKFDEGILIISRSWRLSSRVIIGLAVRGDITLVGLNEKSLLVVWPWKEKTYTTRENDASVIFLHITLFLISQATSKLIISKCLINLGFHSTNTQLTLLPFIVLWYIWFSCTWYKMLPHRWVKVFSISKELFCTCHLKVLHSPGKFSTC